MSAPQLPPPVVIDNRRALLTLADALQGQTRIACDTESNSMHAYRGQTCLIQLSTVDADYLVDPLAIDDISPLGSVFANPAIEKVFHAAEYDLICLKRDFDFDVHPLFDTMAAARVCGYTRIGLRSMLEDLLGIQHSKRHQTADWARRPLSQSQLRYAQVDTRYLLPVRDILYKELEDACRLEEAREYIADIARFELKSQEFDPEGFWDLFRPHSLRPQQKAVLRALYILRDQLAQAYDSPVQMLIPNRTLLALAKGLPTRRKQLSNVAGLPRRLVREYGDEIIEAIAHGSRCRLPNSRPRLESIPQDIADRYSALHSWRKHVATRRGVESDVIISRSALWAIARRQPAHVDELDGIPGLGRWRRRTYGADLVAVVNGRGS